MASFDVVVVGSANTDLISYVPRRPVGGETITGTAFETGFGGKGSNQCVMAAKLGSRTAMVAKLGDDSFGRDTLENYKTNGVNTDSVFITSEAATGVAPIAVDATGENSIIVVPGANNLLSVADVESVRDAITAARVVVCQHEIPLESTLAALQIAKDAGNVVSIFNPAPAQPPLPDAAFTLPGWHSLDLPSTPCAPWSNHLFYSVQLIDCVDGDYSQKVSVDSQVVEGKLSVV
eukprot:m.616180 g.616180  ORF g.616180 m.616180 type:complete len:234 (+) comp22513_c1_seq2:153-854(+)